MANILETANRRAKWREIWYSGVVVTYILAAFDLLVLKVIFGSFGTLVSKWHVTQI